MRDRPLGRDGQRNRHWNFYFAVQLSWNSGVHPNVEYGYDASEATMMRQDNPVLRGSASIFAGRPVGRWVSPGGECGSGLVEYAIVFMILITMLLGIVDFGRALYAYHFVYNAAREDTRYAMVRGSASCPGFSDCDASPDTLNTTFEQNVPLGIDVTPVDGTPVFVVTTTSPASAMAPLSAVRLMVITLPAVRFRFK